MYIKLGIQGYRILLIYVDILKFFNRFKGNYFFE